MNVYLMKRWAVALGGAALLAVAGPVACDKKEEAPAAGEKAEGEADKKAPEKKKTLEGFFTSKAPELQGPHAKLKFGMTEEEAKAAAPEMFEGKYPGVDSAEYEGVSFDAYFPKKTGKLQSLTVKLPKAGALDALKAAWGEPKEGEDLGKKQQHWFNAEAGVRAVLKDGFGEDMDLVLTPYVPAAQLIGADKGVPFGFEKDQAILGATDEQLKTAFAAYYVATSKEEAEKQRKAIEKMAEKDLSALGAAKPSVHLDLPPTEWGSYWTRVNVTWSDDGKVERYRFGVDYEPHPAAKDEILGLLKAKFGEPTEGEKYGRKFLQFSATPSVKVEDNTISKSIDVTVEPGAPAAAE